MANRDLKTDEELEKTLSLAREGNSYEKDRLFKRYMKLLWAIANRELGADLRRHVGASDIVQNTMLKADRDFGNFRGSGLAEFTGWLEAILRHDLANVVASIRDTKKREREREQPLGEMELSGSDPTPSLLVSMKEQKQLILATFAKLSPDLQDCLRADLEDSQPLEDIAAALNISADAVRKRIARGIDEWIELARKEGVTFNVESTDMRSILASESQEEYVPEKLGPYRIERELGNGTFGVVYLATNVRTSGLVALKILRGSISEWSQVRERFFREGRILARLDHKNLVKLIEVGEIDEICFIASEQCKGPTLREWQTAHKTLLSLPLACSIVEQLARAVSYVHSRGVIHRDIKPANILMDPITNDHAGNSGADSKVKFIPKLVDFGLAKSLLEDSGITVSGMMIGTHVYMAPEQAGVVKHDLGPWTDIYSLGVVLFELLTQISPAQASIQFVGLSRNVFENLPPIRTIRPDIPVEVERILDRCLALHPNDRYSDAELLANDLSGLFELTDD